ncbi:MAG: NAD-dependent epimerase/dehydratase family protein [Hyphomonadaceae bacterium]
MYLVTGAAGFIGFHVASRLLDEGEAVFGVDSLNDYYDVALKRARLAQLAGRGGFRFAEVDVADIDALRAAAPPGVTQVIHLAAQAGVRYSLEAPFAYEHSNLKGHLAMLEYARGLDGLRHFVYASSSSVYGDRSDGPFRESDRCDAPRSLYAATKRACELMSETYAHLHGLPQTGLRFFTVYGPWGRPDMAYWTFSEKILRGQPIELYGEGKLARDFTYIEDVAPAIARIAAAPAADGAHRLYNIGNSRPATVLELVDCIERALGRKADRRLVAQLKTEVSATFADHARATADFGFEPKTSIEEGIPRFTTWLKGWLNG